jgi:hypothetical protein
MTLSGPVVQESVEIVSAGDEPGSVETTAFLIGYDGRGPVGLLTTTDDDAVQWAEKYYRTIRSETGAATASSPEAGAVAGASYLDGDRLPMALRSDGFVRVDERVLDRHEPMAPTTAWRAGLGLPKSTQATQSRG